MEAAGIKWECAVSPKLAAGAEKEPPNVRALIWNLSLSSDGRIEDSKPPGGGKRAACWRRRPLLEAQPVYQL